MPVAHIRHHHLSPVVSGIAEYRREFLHDLFPRFPVSHCKSVISRSESANTTSKKLCQGIFDFFLHHENSATTPLKFSYCQKENLRFAHVARLHGNGRRTGEEPSRPLLRIMNGCRLVDRERRKPCRGLHYCGRTVYGNSRAAAWT